MDRRYFARLRRKLKRVLCKRFRLSFPSTLQAFREYVDIGGRHIPIDVTKLVKCSKIIPRSLFNYERGFSSMNNIIANTRSRLEIEHVSNLMFVELHGPPLENWKPKEYNMFKNG